MKVLQRAILLTICFIGCLLLISCINMEYKITINNDNSCDIQYKALVNSMLTGFMNQNDDTNIFADMTDSAKKEGYTVSNISEGDSTGIKAVKHIENLEIALKNGDPFGEISSSFPIKPGKDLKINKSFFKTEYALDTDIDLTSLDMSTSSDSNDWSDSLTESMIQSMKFRFILSIPKEATNNNASLVEDSNKTLIWDLMPGKHNNVNASIIIQNKNAYIVVGVISALALAVIIYSIIFTIKKNRHLTHASTL